jgi:hypothetical protein
VSATEGKAERFSSSIVYNKELHYKILRWMKHSLPNWSVDSYDIPNHLDGRVLWSARDVLQFIGTEVMRYYKPDYHIDVCFCTMVGSSGYVVSDLRFPNEGDRIRSAGGFCINLVRNTGFEASCNRFHQSEEAMNNWDGWFGTIDNRKNGFQNLYTQIDRIMEKINGVWRTKNNS